MANAEGVGDERAIGGNSLTKYPHDFVMGVYFLWIYKGVEVTDDLISGFEGFVYLITNLETSRKYVGKKGVLSRRRKIVKGKAKRIVKESDWRTYYGSSEELLRDVEALGEDAFRREILHLCLRKGDCSYLELREQMDRRVLENPQSYYNSFVGAKIHRIHLSSSRGIAFADISEASI